MADDCVRSMLPHVSVCTVCHTGTVVGQKLKNSAQTAVSSEYDCSIDDIYDF